MTMTRTVLFDFDGTLADTRARILYCCRAATGVVLGRVYPDSPAEERELWMRNGWGVLETLTNDPEDRQAMVKLFAEAYRAPDAPPITAFVGIPEAFVALRSSGIRLGVVTAKARQRFESDIRDLTLLEHISVSVCAEDITAHKPDPEGLQLALARLGATADGVAYVGDSPQDIAAALAAGVTPIGVGWGVYGAEDLRAAGARHVVHTPEELPGTLRRS